MSKILRRQKKGNKAAKLDLIIFFEKNLRLPHKYVFYNF